MRVLEYNDLDISGVESQYRKVVEMLSQDDFRSAEVKKLSPTPYFRAKLDYSNRLIFQIRKHNGKRYVLLLEVVRNHAYEKSRFLRGTSVDEEKIPDFVFESLQPLGQPLEPALGQPELNQTLDAENQPLPYVNEGSKKFHILDKALSFDEAQSEIYRLPPPIIIIGSAGSGKTALTLEKMKQMKGDILYVTLSAFLAKNARDLYYANHYENENQNIDFLSFREFLETIHVPQGQEVTYARFREWFTHHQPFYKFTDAHKLFEEFKGVMTGSFTGSSASLSREQYLALGVKQSIFLSEERSPVYDIFEKYLKFLDENGLYDTNVLSHQYIARCKASYDFAVIDEVQDLTPVQLALILRSLKKNRDFLLCGDSNQIVHPNFFSWSKVKTLFHSGNFLTQESGQGDGKDVGEESSPQSQKEIIHILKTNFRNSDEVTRISNSLLKIKQRRFGSIDKESNYLITSVPHNSGKVELLSDKDATKRDLDEKTRKSTKFAVLVMREEQKAEARKWFRTPLLFCVQEAKGLEYENVILFNFVSSDRGAFSKISEGISRSDLEEDLIYSRGKDKTDKSGEVYKFFVNSLYVAITRAVKNLYLVESNSNHELLNLLGVRESQQSATVTSQNSSMEEWQREARKLELQGKKEQAEEIRRQILKSKPVPWKVLDPKTFTETLDQALDPKNVSKKPKEQIFEYSAFYLEPRLRALLGPANFDKGKNISQSIPQVMKKYLGSFEMRYPRESLLQIDQYGADFRNAFNCTPLMCAGRQGNTSLIEMLLAKGANPDLIDNYGRTAFHQVLISARDSEFAKTRLSVTYRLLSPGSISVQVDDRLVKLDAQTMEYFLFNVMLALLHQKLNALDGYAVFSGFAADDFLDYVASFPEDVLTERRKRRAYLSSVLSRNEVERDYAYNRRIFLRLKTGHYTLNPELKIRSGENWVDLQEYLGFGLMLNRPCPKVQTYHERIFSYLKRKSGSLTTVKSPTRHD